ncbi:MAG: LysM peptidoglycan-binding domain-containing protein [Bacillota bacterium]|jgi:LysM repeat protein
MKRRVGRKKLNLHKLKRSLIFGLVLALFISVGLKAAAANFNETKSYSAYIEVMVKSGDSLWELTNTYYHGDEDIRKIIYRIKEINRLENAEIFPGQILKIPQI